MRSAAERLRSEILSMADAHQRSVGNLAQLLSGFEVFLYFIEDSDAIDAPR